MSKMIISFEDGKLKSIWTDFKIDVLDVYDWDHIKNRTTREDEFTVQFGAEIRLLKRHGFDDVAFRHEQTAFDF